MERHIRTQAGFSQLKDKARSRNIVKVFSRSPACKAFPTRSGLLGHKGSRIILPSSLYPCPHHTLFR